MRIKKISRQQGRFYMGVDQEENKKEVKSIKKTSRWIKEPKPVTHPRFCDEVVRPAGVRLNFSSQIADVDLQHVCLAVICISPDGEQQLAVREDFASMFNQRAQDIILGRG
jgi:hypothetical protein